MSYLTEDIGEDVRYWEKGGLYAVNSGAIYTKEKDGRYKRLDRIRRTKAGKGFYIVKYVDPVSGNRREVEVHLVIAELFCKKGENSKKVYARDENLCNPRQSNLYWNGCKENNFLPRDQYEAAMNAGQSGAETDATPSDTDDAAKSSGEAITPQTDETPEINFTPWDELSNPEWGLDDMERESISEAEHAGTAPDKEGSPAGDKPDTDNPDKDTAESGAETPDVSEPDWGLEDLEFGTATADQAQKKESGKSNLLRGGDTANQEYAEFVETLPEGFVEAERSTGLFINRDAVVYHFERLMYRRLRHCYINMNGMRGIHVVRFQDETGKTVQRHVGKLLAEAFLNPDGRKIFRVIYKDGDVGNLDLSNLVVKFQGIKREEYYTGKKSASKPIMAYADVTLDDFMNYMHYAADMQEKTVMCGSSFVQLKAGDVCKTNHEMAGEMSVTPYKLDKLIKQAEYTGKITRRVINNVRIFTITGYGDTDSSPMTFGAGPGDLWENEKPFPANATPANAESHGGAEQMISSDILSDVLPKEAIAFHIARFGERYSIEEGRDYRKTGDGYMLSMAAVIWLLWQERVEDFHRISDIVKHFGTVKQDVRTAAYNLARAAEELYRTLDR